MSGLAGRTIENFSHNNMVPFFGSHVTQRTVNLDGNESALDNMQGAGSQQIRKKAQAPLFAPQKNMGWAHGTPNFSNFMQSRVNPSMKMSNVKPFDSQNVGPGLNHGYTNKGSGGFNSGMEARDKWIAKSVDELRVKTNPKITYPGVILGGKRPVQNRGIEGNIEKYRPDTFYINGPERYFTTTGAEKAPTVRSQEILKPETRTATTREYFGGGEREAKGTYIPGKYEQPLRPTLKSDAEYPGAANAAGKWQAGGHGSMDDYGRDGYNLPANERMLTASNNYSAPAAGSVIGAVIAPLLDVLRPSRKENAVGTIRPTGNAHSTVSKPPAYNPADQPKTTMKETTLESKNFGGMPNSETSDAYLVNIANNSERAVRQQRDDTNCEYISNPGTALRSKARVYNAEYNMSLNADKQILTQGRSPNGNMAIYNGYTNIKIDKLDSDRNPNRGTFSNNSTIVGGPSKEILGKMHQRAPIGMGQSCTRNSSDMLDAFRCNPYTQSLHGAA